MDFAALAGALKLENRSNHRFVLNCESDTYRDLLEQLQSLTETGINDQQLSIEVGNRPLRSLEDIGDLMIPQFDGEDGLYDIVKVTQNGTTMAFGIARPPAYGVNGRKTNYVLVAQDSDSWEDNQQFRNALSERYSALSPHPSITRRLHFTDNSNL